MDRRLHEAEERIFALLVIRLEDLIRRRTPVRRLTAGPVQRTARLMFADGATLLVRARRPGSSAAVAKATLAGAPVLLESWRRERDGFVLILSVVGRRRTARHEVLLLGADQPD